MEAEQIGKAGGQKKPRKLERDDFLPIVIAVQLFVCA
jgi:hypothetical protein